MGAGQGKRVLWVQGGRRVGKRYRVGAGQVESAGWVKGAGSVASGFVFNFI